MKILYKTITEDTQVYVGDCYLVGAELTRTAATDTVMIVYDENDSDKTAAQKVITLVTSDETQGDNRIFPLPGIKCEGIYVDWTAGVGTVYYYL